MNRKIVVATTVLCLLVAMILLGQPSPITPVAVTATISGNVNTQGLGTAGSPSGGVMTVQGVTSMTPFLIQGSAADAAAPGNGVLLAGLGSGGVVRTMFNANAQSDAANGANLPTIGVYTFNGGAWDKRRSADLTSYNVASTLTGVNSIGAALGEKGSRWSVVSSPAANSQATASIANEASVRHVVDTVCFSATSNAAVVAANGTVDIRDGATGAGTVIAQFRVAIQVAAAAGVQIVPPFCVSDLNLVGTTNTAMTAEFSAGVTGATESVTLSGFNVN
jgi:hypothetical protein